MPTTVEDIKTLEVDGKKIEMRPLKIKKLRVFMKEFENLSTAGADNDKSIDTLIACCVIAMEQYEPKMANKDTLEEILDMSDVYLIIEAATGIRLGDGAGNPVAAPRGAN